jgi:catechol 2,3-dioxygenase-like lactoylglutathione lyase family enzyme
MIKVKRISHATFETPDIERLTDYYIGVIGLVPLQREKDRVLFVSRLGDISVILTRGSAAKLSKIAFQVAPQDDLKTHARFLADQGIRSSVDQVSLPGIETMLTFRDPKGTAITVTSGQLQHARRTAELAALYEFHNSMRDAERTLSDAANDAERKRALFEFLNLLEINAAAVQRRLFVGASAVMVRDKLLDSLAVMQVTPGIRDDLERAVSTEAALTYLADFMQRNGSALHRRVAQVASRRNAVSTDSPSS